MASPPPDVTDLWIAEDYQGRWRRLLEWLNPLLGERVLDVGFGAGEALRYLSPRLGPRGRAIGVSPAVVRAINVREAIIRERTPPVALGAVAQALPFRGAAFDAVLCVNVLEAVPPPERPTALTEIRRVLRKGGRVLLAHDDWESHAYAGADRDLTRRCVRAYADARFKSYAASDGQMGRHLWGLFRAAGFRDAKLRAVPLINTAYREPLFGWNHSRVPLDLIPEGSQVIQADVDRWHAEFTAASERGEYAFCGTLYVCLGRK